MKYYVPVFSCLTFLYLTLFSSLTHAEARLTLVNGDVLKGEVIYHENGTLNFNHTVLGEINLKDEQISLIVRDFKPEPNAHIVNTSDTPGNTQAVTEEPILATEAITKGSDENHFTWLENWEKQLEIGISGADGNSQSQNIHMALVAKTESDQHRWGLQAAYDASEKDGEKSQDEFFTRVNRDWLIPQSSHFYFASGRFDWDEFQDWDYRINLSGGRGKDFVHRENWTLRGRAGLGFNREFGGEDDSISPEGLLELDSTWLLSEDHKIELKTTFYPQLDELREFRNITTLAWINKLNDSMRLKVGLSNEHDTDVPDGIKKNDFKYATSLVWDL